MALLGNILGSGSGNVLDRESRILSSSNPARVRLGKSRKYLDDYNKFGSVFTLKNFVIQFTKGACLPLLGITKELEAFNKRQLQAYERREEFREEFDWEAAVKKQLPVLIPSVQRFYLTSFIRKGYDLCLIVNYSPRVVDHFCKDITRSAIRKLNKLGRLNASMAMVKTAVAGNFLNYFSSLTYDILLGVFEFLNARNRKFDPVRALRWVAKRSLYYSVLLVSSSIGFSLGTLIGDKGQTTSVILSLVAETIAGEAAGKYLN
jgi:hypothetical protein